MLLAGCAQELSEQDRQAAAEYDSHRQQRTGHHPSAAPTTSASALPSRFRTWQELADVIGCEARLQGRAADFRQAACVKDGDTFVLLDFDTKKGQRDWLEYAMLYGGIYLVGDRWVLSGRSKEYMEGLRSTLGGKVEWTNEHGGGA
jgi:hypothetical protein